MAQASLIISLGLFLLLAAAFVFVLWRAARVVAATREDDTFRRDGVALAERSAASIAAAAERIDRVRRRQDAPDTLAQHVPGMLDALAELRAEADRLSPPPALAPRRDRIAEEVDRASRAIEMVEHGCRLLSVSSGRPRELEGETSVKRGYLNLLHAREALVTLGVALAAGRMEASRWFSDRPRAR